MKKIIITEELRKKILNLHYNNVISEQNLVKLAKNFFKTTAKSVDEFKSVLKNLPDVVGEIDYFINLAKLEKSLTPTEDLVAKVYHIFNPGALPELVQPAKEQTARLLNAYAQLKHGKSNFKEVKEMIVPPKVKTNGSNPNKTPNENPNPNYNKSNIKTYSLKTICSDDTITAFIKKYSEKSLNVGYEKLNELNKFIEKVSSGFGYNNIRNDSFLSASGSVLPFKDFNDLLRRYVTDDIDKYTFISSMPRNLQSGSVFRSELDKIL